MKGDIIGSEKGVEAGSIVKLGMDRNPPQESLELCPPLLDEGGGETRYGLFFGEGGDDGPGSFFVEAFVEPEKVGISAEDCGVACVLEDVVRALVVVVFAWLGWRSDVYSVGCVFVDSLGMLDGVRNLSCVKME